MAAYTEGYRKYVVVVPDNGMPHAAQITRGKEFWNMFKPNIISIWWSNCNDKYVVLATNRTRQLELNFESISSNNDQRPPQGCVRFRNLVSLYQLPLNSDFGPHWVFHNFELVSHLSYVLKITIRQWLTQNYQWIDKPNPHPHKRPKVDLHGRKTMLYVL